MSATEFQQSASQPPGDSLDASGSALPEASNIDKIREILFGVQMRDYEKRFARLEERLLKESSDLRDDTRKRFEALEAFVKSEFEALSERLLAEQRNRDESVQNLARELQDTGRRLEGKLGQLDEQTSRAQRELRQQLLDQSKNLSDEIRQKADELSALLDRQISELGDAKTDRAALAGLFSEVALRLNNEFKIPGNE